MKTRWLLLATLPLGGCMTSGTNMHGDFACKAPNGTCAPMSSIDAAAIAGMSGSAQPVGGVEMRDVPRGGRVVEASAGSVPARTSDRVLQIVFPAHIDANGIYHDQATAHAVVEPSSWTESLTGRPASVSIATAANTPAQALSETSALATLDEVIAAKGAHAVATHARGPMEAAPAAAVEGITPAAWSRDPSALNLREAAAGASGGTVPELDGSNFDTPDVAAALGSAPTGSRSDATASPRSKTVHWHGHKVRVTSNGQALRTATAAPAMQSARSLNLASFGQSDGSGDPTSDTGPGDSASSDETSRPAVATSGYSTRQVIGSSVAPTAAAPLTATIKPLAAATPPAGIAVPPSATTSAAVAAARVRMMAAPVIANGVTGGRAEAAAEATPDDNPFTALVAAGNGRTVEPRP